MSSISEPRRSKRKLVFSKGYESKKASGSVWSEEDDISLLKAMIGYEVTKQANPYHSMREFLDFVKPFISFDVHRKQLTDKLWKLRKKFVNSKYDALKPHHAKLLELSKSIKCWEQHANVSLDDENIMNGDCGNFENVVDSDGPNVGGVTVVVDDIDVEKSSKVVESKGKGKVVTFEIQSVEQDNENIDDDSFLKEVWKLGKKNRKRLSRDGQNEKEDNVVLDVVDGGKCSEAVKYKKGKVVENKGKGKVVTSNSQNAEEDNVAKDVDDVPIECLNGDGDNFENVANYDCQNIRGDNVVVGDVEVDKALKVVEHSGKGKVVENKGKGKVMTCDGENDKEDAGVLGNENVRKEVNRKDLNDFTSLYPELTRALELETLSGMPKKCVMDIISSMGRRKASELEEKWADFRLMEVELNAKKLDLSNKQIKVILEASTNKFRP